MISGSFQNNPQNDFIGFTDAIGLGIGTGFRLSNLTSEWAVVDASITNSTQSTRVRIRTDNATAAVIEIRNMRAVDGTESAPAFPVGTGAGEVMTDGGTLVQIAVPYGWSEDDSPASAFVRYWANGSAYQRINNDTTILAYDGSTILTRAPSPTANVLNVSSFDWSGAQIGLRHSTTARASFASTYTASGDLYLLNRSLADVSFHGKGKFSIFSRVLSDAEYEVLRARNES